ncbi:MAG: 16S rRNA (uracil(1498)-N(3))-methyltransferase [Candidatus Brocadiia bacterium]
MKRFSLAFVPSVGAVVSLGIEESRHLAARRVEVGESVELLSPDGTVSTGELVSRKPYEVRITDIVAPVASHPLTICVALPQANRASTMVEKCTEIGVGRIQPIICRRGVAIPRSGDALIERWGRVAMAAAKQSGAQVPTILPPLPFDRVIRLPGQSVVLSPEGEQSLGDFLDARTTDEVSIFVGPEGGFSTEEIAVAREAGVTLCSMGRTILRVETAAIVACALYAERL